MAEVALTRLQLDELLAEQIEFLKASNDAFDRGFLGEAKRLAVVARVLVHDTAKSQSLLGQLGMKSMPFFDSSHPFDGNNLLSHSSLVQIHAKRQGRMVPMPHLDSGLPGRTVAFEDWWNGIVLVDKNRIEFSRKDIVQFLANKEGGAHVDPNIDKAYQDLRLNNSLGWTTSSGDGKDVAGEDHVPATMRQISHELLKTLDPSHAQVHPNDPQTDGMMFGMSLTVGAIPPVIPSSNLRKDRPRVGGKKIGVNDPCACGSGLKYKKCCGKP